MVLYGTQHRDPGNIGHTRHRTKTNKTHNTETLARLGTQDIEQRQTNRQNRQHRDPGYIGHTRHRTKTNKTDRIDNTETLATLDTQDTEQGLTIQSKT